MPSGLDPFPVPHDLRDVQDFVRSLRAVKVWAGDPSLESLRRRTGVAKSTLADAFKPERRRMPSLDLVRVVVRACGGDESHVVAWEHAWRVLRAHIDASSSTAASLAEPHRAGPPTPGEVVPRQLPAVPWGFTGRADTLQALAGRIDQVAVTVITGMPGVGKTALAVHWAHQIAERFPDGQLYLDLRGHGGDRAVTPSEALSLLLQSLGVAVELIPVDVDLQVGLYRSVLAERRVLVVLDNGADPAQVRPLLPAGPGCHAVITSRGSLSGLVAREGAVQVTLDTLSPGESLELLRTHLGAVRVEAEPEATAELAGLCARLPLALRIAAANLAGRPQQTIAATVAQLRSSDLLDHLRITGDPQSAVAAAFEVSYRHLSLASRQLFRLLGLVPGPEVDPVASAVLLRRDPQDPVPELEELCAAHLLEESSPGRYRSHDLLTLFAQRQADGLSPAVREAVRHRLFSWYMLNIDATARILRPIALVDRSELGLVGTVPDFAGPVEAVAWLRTELPNLTKAVIECADRGPAPFAWHLSQALAGFLYLRGSAVEQLTIAQAGLRAAEAADNALGQAHSQLSIGAAKAGLGQLRAAKEAWESAREHYRRCHHTRGVSSTLTNLGDVCIRIGEIDQAERYFEEALEISATLSGGAAAGEAPPITVIVTKLNLAMTYTVRGRHADAMRLTYECLDYASKFGSDQAKAMAQAGLAVTHLELGDFGAAEKIFIETYSDAIELGNDLQAYDALAGLVQVCARTGRTEESIAWITRLDELLQRGVSSHRGDDRAHPAILEALLAAGRIDQGITVGEAALGQYDRAGQRLSAMRVRIELGRLHAAQGNDETARSYWQSVLPYTVEQALPSQAVVKQLLDDLP